MLVKWGESLCSGTKGVPEKSRSYQGIYGTSFADAHLLINRFEVLVDLQIFQASFKRLHGDVVSEGKRISAKKERRLTAWLMPY